MPMDRWPFIPECLTDILDEEFVSFIQSGSSVKTGMPLAIVELRRDVNGKKYPHTIPPGDRWLNFSEFCKYLRGIDEKTGNPFFPGADEKCREFDGHRALDFLENRLISPPGRTGFSYQCHMGLCDMVAPIEVAGKKIACIFGGQGLPTSPEKVEKIHQEIELLQRRAKEGIGIAGGNAEYLEECITALDEYSGTLLGKLEFESQRISKFASEERDLIKIRRQEDFLNTLNRDYPEDLEGIDRVLEENLTLIAQWIPVSFLMVFLCEKSDDTVLKKKMSFGLPENESGADVHFNWKKAGLPVNQRPPVHEKNNSLISGLTYGFRGPHSAAMRTKVKVIVPLGIAANYRAVVCFGPLESGEDLLGERHFLEKLAAWLCDPYLEKLNLIHMSEREELWEDAAALIGHQVRSSLNPITVETGIIKRGALDKRKWVTDERMAKSLSIISAEAQALGDYATEALEFWRWIMGTGEKNFTKQKISLLLINCINRFRGAAEDAGLTIEVEPGVEALPEAEIFGRTLEVALLNVIENAIKYSFDNHTIRISGTYINHWISIKIDNFGIGIPADELDRIFEKRYRGQYRGRKMRRQGEGLGLWQTREVLRAHGGDVTVESKTRDRRPTSRDSEHFRTVFTLSFPMEQRYRKED